MREGKVSFVCLKMSKQMKREKKITADSVFYFVANVVYSRFIDINKTKQ